MRLVSAVLDWAIRSLTQHYERLDFDSDLQAPLTPKTASSLRQGAPAPAK